MAWRDSRSRAGAIQGSGTSEACIESEMPETDTASTRWRSSPILFSRADAGPAMEETALGVRRRLF